MHTECYVFEANSVPEPVLVGKYWLEDGVGSFVYGKSWLARPDAFAIDPINLPLTEAVFNPKKANGPINVLADAGVDNWGRRLITAIHERVPRNPVEWLLASGGRGAGCLMFSASRNSVKPVLSTITIEQLGQYLNVARGVLEKPDYSVPKEFVKLVEHGTSMGGARPKALVTVDGFEYIAKFNRTDDGLEDLSRIERLSMKLAQQCGIHTAEVSAIDQGKQGEILMVKRFDRMADSTSRIHYISGHSLLNFAHVAVADYTEDYSYIGIAKAIQKISAAPEVDAKQLYMRMVFNGLIGNSDDHMRNHGMVMVDRTKGLFRLSPAFDVLPHYLGTPQLMAIGCGADGQRATYENLLSRCEMFYLSRSEAREIIKDVRDKVQNHHDYYAQNDVSAHDLKMIAPCFDLAYAPMPQEAVTRKQKAKPTNESKAIVDALTKVFNGPVKQHVEPVDPAPSHEKSSRKIESSFEP